MGSYNRSRRRIFRFWKKNYFKYENGISPQDAALSEISQSCLPYYDEEMVKGMSPGSIIYDLAVGQGGNCAYSEPDKIKLINGVKIMGSSNILNN